MSEEGSVETCLVVAGVADPGALRLETVSQSPGSTTPATTEGDARAGDAFHRAVRAILTVFLLLCACVHLGRAASPEFSNDIVLVIGAPGEESYQAGFTAAADAWREASRRAGARLTVIGLEPLTEGSPSDRERVQSALAALNPKAPTPVWIVYVGHGTFDHKEAWWNLRGADVSGEELVHWIEPLHDRTLIVVHGGSASGPFIPLLSAPGRIIITATRSGEEVNYARFGERFAQAIASPRADLDQDGSTSLLEAFLLAAKETQSLYAENGRMATEHALIDDNGDKLGTPSDWFQGVRVVKRPDGKTEEADGFRAHQIALVEAPNLPVLTAEQRQLRDRLEEEVEALRHRRAKLSEADYLRELEPVLRKLAEVYSEPK